MAEPSPHSPLPLPPGQQLVAAGKWPLVGERTPRDSAEPWTISVAGLVATPLTLSLEQLTALPQVERVIDIHCVTRWSKPATTFCGVLLAELLQQCDVQSEAKFVSFVARSERSHSTSLPLAEALNLGVLVALGAEGRPLPTEHGGPVRIVTPGRYFYKSLKWLERIELLADDRLGHWEQAAGYHNVADPHREERYIAADIPRHELRSLLKRRDFRDRDLLSLQAAGRELMGLVAARARLRNANFSDARLNVADFRGANLSNAHFRRADLRGAVFSGADLEGADFSGANLRSADFRGALLTAVTFRTIGPDRAALAAIIDATTQFDPAAADQLMPDQAEFLRSATIVT